MLSSGDVHPDCGFFLADHLVKVATNKYSGGQISCCAIITLIAQLRGVTIDPYYFGCDLEIGGPLMLDATYCQDAELIKNSNGKWVFPVKCGISVPAPNPYSINLTGQCTWHLHNGRIPADLIGEPQLPPE